MKKNEIINEFTALSATKVALALNMSYKKANYICKMIRALYSDFYEEQFNYLKYGQKFICLKHLMEYSQIPFKIIKESLETILT